MQSTCTDDTRMESRVDCNLLNQTWRIWRTFNCVIMIKVTFYSLLNCDTVSMTELEITRFSIARRRMKLRLPFFFSFIDFHIYTAPSELKGALSLSLSFINKVPTICAHCTCTGRADIHIHTRYTCIGQTHTHAQCPLPIAHSTSTASVHKYNITAKYTATAKVTADAECFNLTELCLCPSRMGIISSCLCMCAVYVNFSTKLVDEGETERRRARENAKWEEKIKWKHTNFFFFFYFVILDVNISAHWCLLFCCAAHAEWFMNSLFAYREFVEIVLFRGPLIGSDAMMISYFRNKICAWLTQVTHKTCRQHRFWLIESVRKGWYSELWYQS